MPEISPSQWLLVIPLLSGMAAFVLILVLTPFAGKMRLLDLPDERKRHREPTPDGRWDRDLSGPDGGPSGGVAPGEAGLDDGVGDGPGRGRFLG